MKDNVFNILFKFISRFLKNQSYSFERNETVSSEVIHYFFEIIRNWNKLNYLIKKIQRSVQLNENLNELEMCFLLYIAYRIRFENADLKSIREELLKIKIAEVFSNNIENLFEKILKFSWEIALTGKSEIEKLSIKEATPSFLIKKLVNIMDIGTIEENLKVMNNFKDQKNFSAYFFTEEENNYFSKDLEVPNLFHVPINMKGQLINSELFSSGRIIILDKASASVVNILSPNPYDFILDMCAAPGVKTSLISHNTKHKSHIIAIDFSQERAKDLKNFTKNINNHKIFYLNSDSISIPLRTSLKFDKILLDAPCTGSGALLANPVLKWRQNDKFLHQNMVIQEKLLKSAIKLLKPSGILVYSTCSLYPEEGEYQIKKFLEKLIPMELPDWLGKSYKIDGSYILGTARLFPAQHHTEGFFIAKFKKKK